MFTGKKFSRFATLAVSAAVLTFAAVEANATHFRYGTMNWTRDATNPLQVTFNVTEAWRASFTSSLAFSSTAGGFNTNTNRTTVGTFTDTAGEQYTVFNTAITQTFPNAGVFNVNSSSCCRISTLQNNNNDTSYNINAVVDLSEPLANNVGSPVAQAPIIVPLPISTTASFQLPFADPDLEGVTVSVAAISQSGLTTAIPNAGGNALTISGTGLIEWNTTGASAGQKYAIQLRVDENDSANSIPVDFIIEIGNGSGNLAPSVDGASLNLEVGDILDFTVTGNDPDNGPVDPLAWTLDSITGPQTVGNATFDETTQQLIWDTTGFDLGTYTFFISNFDGAANGLGQILVTVSASTISEPGMALVLGLGILGVAYTRRRKAAKKS